MESEGKDGEIGKEHQFFKYVAQMVKKYACQDIFQ